MSAERMFNDDQIEHMEHMASLPADQKCACGWNQRGDCFGSCFGDEAKGGFVKCMAPGPCQRTCDLRRGHEELEHLSHGPNVHTGTGWSSDPVKWEARTSAATVPDAELVAWLVTHGEEFWLIREEDRQSMPIEGTLPHAAIWAPLYRATPTRAEVDPRIERVERVLADMDALIADEYEVAKDCPPGPSMHATNMCREWWADRIRDALGATVEKSDG